MRRSIKRSLTGLLVVGAVACSVIGASAMGGGGNSNGPDAGIGIIGGIGQRYNYSAGGDSYQGGYQGGGFQANASHRYHNYGGYGGNNGGYYQGY